MKNICGKALAAMTTALILSVVGLTGCADGNSSEQTSELTSSSVTESNIDKSIDASDLDVGYDETEACVIAFNGTEAEINGSGASSENGIVTVSKSGTYILSGTVSNGRVIVDADKDAEIKLIFKGVNISCSDNAPIYVSNAKKVYITLEENTENSLSDGSEYSLGEDDSNTDGALFTKADLTINGSGKLSVTSNYKHAIVSKDDLVITDGVFDISSASSAIVGKDCVKISGGNFEIDAGTNAIKSTNAEETDKGFISITGGSFNINAGGDGLDAETVLSIDGGTFDIMTGGGSQNSSMKADGTPNEDWRNQMGGGRPIGGYPGATGGDPGTMGEPPVNADMYQQTAYTDTTTATDDSGTTSAKALKAGSQIKISGGEFNIDSADDVLHSNGSVEISGGTINGASGDDGIHADSDLVINDGNITFTKTYEGIEGMTVTVNGGEINVTSTDDGFNCAGGSDTGSTQRPGADMFAAEEGAYLKITGGTITVDSSGDGLDSNGDLYVEGGTIIVYGPTNSGNGALDYNGTAKVTGGTLAAFGSSGMAQGFGTDSTQYSFLQNLSTGVEAGSEVTISDSSGNALLTCTSEKTWNSVLFTSPELVDGGTYSIVCGSITESATLSGIVTSNGNSGGFGGKGGGKRF